MNIGFLLGGELNGAICCSKYQITIFTLTGDVVAVFEVVQTDIFANTYHFSCFEIYIRYSLVCSKPKAVPVIELHTMNVV